MSEIKIVVPNGMKAAIAPVFRQWFGGGSHHGELDDILEPALRWLSENPLIPNDLQAEELWSHPHQVLNDKEHYAKAIVREWQRVMFLAPEPVVPKEIEDLMTPLRNIDESNYTKIRALDSNAAIVEAFNRGKRAGKG